eukprot:jgi/Botrbrau1/13651/Bobra.0292s0001.2
MASIAAALPESQGTDTEAITVVEPPSFVALTELVKEVHGRDGAILTENFLDLNRKLLPVLDQFGTGFTFVRADIKGNIDRLNRAYQKDPQKFHNLFEIVLDEVARGQDGLRDSDTKGLLWLKRAMEFLIGLLQGLYNDRNMTVLAAAEASYAEYLKPFHGYITYGAFCVALKKMDMLGSNTFPIWKCNG